MKPPNKKSAPRRRKKQPPFGLRQFIGVIFGLVIIPPSFLLLGCAIDILKEKSFGGAAVMSYLGMSGLFLGVYRIYVSFYDRAEDNDDVL